MMEEHSGGDGGGVGGEEGGGGGDGLTGERKGVAVSVRRTGEGVGEGYGGGCGQSPRAGGDDTGGSVCGGGGGGGDDGYSLCLDDRGGGDVLDGKGHGWGLCGARTGVGCGWTTQRRARTDPPGGRRPGCGWGR